MTVCEELMHCVLGHKGILNRSTSTKAYETSPKYMKMERDARRHAAAFICPEFLVPETFSPELLVEKFPLSVSAAAIRHEEISRLRRRRKGEKRQLPRDFAEFLRKLKEGQGLPASKAS
jgi:Zn-dependent peptidase ImmA (M78 family)